MYNNNIIDVRDRAISVINSKIKKEEKRALIRGLHCFLFILIGTVGSFIGFILGNRIFLDLL